MLAEPELDIHDFKSRLERAELRLHNPLSQRNIEMILTFEKVCVRAGLSTTQVEKYVTTLKRIAKMLGKDFDKASKKDIDDFIYKIERSDYSPWTKHDYKVVTKKFYKSLKGTKEGYPEEVSEIKTTLHAKGETTSRGSCYRR